MRDGGRPKRRFGEPLRIESAGKRQTTRRDSSPWMRPGGVMPRFVGFARLPQPDPQPMKPHRTRGWRRGDALQVL